MEHNNITGVLPDPLPPSLTLLAVRHLLPRAACAAWLMRLLTR